MRVGGVRRLDFFDHRCLYTIAGNGRNDRVSNVDVTSIALGAKLMSVYETVQCVSWVTLHMASTRLPCRNLICVPPTDCENPCRYLPMPWQLGMRNCTANVNDMVGSEGPVNYPTGDNV